MTKNPKALRALADKYLAEAKKEEAAIAGKIGRIIMAASEKNFKDFDFEFFKLEVKKIIG